MSGNDRPETASRSGPRLKVFISYSRKDSPFAEDLLAALETCGFDAYLDKEDIAPGEAWETRLGRLILEADTVVYVVSPDSIASRRCVWEIEETERLAKRLLPVVCRPVEEALVPERLRRLNYIFFDKPGTFGRALAALAGALDTDLAWLRSHTHLLEEATRWDERGRPEPLLLRGSALDEALTWRAARPQNAPEPNDLQRTFIAESEAAEARRQSAERQQLAAMAEAQDARERALSKAAEALKEAAQAQRRRARARNIALGVVLAAGIVLSVLGLRAMRQAAVITALLDDATGIIIEHHASFNEESQRKAFAIFMHGAEEGRPGSMSNVGASYMLGLGVGQNVDNARIWFERAADLGNTRAMNHLGLLYAQGRVGPVDLSEARRWFEKGADGGDGDCMTNLGATLMEQPSGEASYAEARSWFAKGAESGNADAMVWLGRIYAQGLGVPMDAAVAAQWFRKAGEKGNTKGMIALSRMYRIGSGLSSEGSDQDLWLRRALDKAEEASVTGRAYGADERAERASRVAWYAVLAHEGEQALRAADRALELKPGYHWASLNRAHALLLLSRGLEARNVYLTHKGELVPSENDRTWEDLVAEDFAELRIFGIDDPLMAEVESELGVERK